MVNLIVFNTQVKEKKMDHAKLLKQRMVLERKLAKERAKVDDKV
jgi:hypothetical protein